MIDKAAWRTLRALGRVGVAREIDLQVEGLQHLPSSGPVILAARHYHHLYDGCAIFATVPRHVQAIVGLDWIERPIALRGMQAACRSAGWPVVYRSDNHADRAGRLQVLRKAMAESLAILRQGRILLVFPEGYPTIDPHGSPKTTDDEFLPFQSGFARIAIDAWADRIPARIVPLGFQYRQGDRWQVAMRFGEPVGPCSDRRPAELSADIERRVISLSQA